MCDICKKEKNEFNYCIQIINLSENSARSINAKICKKCKKKFEENKIEDLIKWPRSVGDDASHF